MIRNLLLIFALAIGFAALLYFKPWESNQEVPPRIVDRLPTTNLIGSTNVLALSENLSKTLFYYKIPFRDFLTPNFLLGQGKNYGLDLQNPVYFFVEEKEKGVEDWGALISVRDSSKILEGINRIKKVTSINETLLYGAKIFHSSEFDLFLAYGNDWLLIYSGKHLMNRLGKVLYAKNNEVSPRWRSFIDETEKKQEALVARVKSKQLQRFGVEQSEVSLSNDSTSLIFNLAITQEDDLPFTIKQSGMGFAEKEFTRQLVNIHLAMDSLKNKPNHPFFETLKSIGSKISFPTEELIEAWEGDVAFRHGGIQTIKEKYITSELDENFNVTEIIKTRNVQISGFSLYLSMNKKKKELFKALKEKGILTKQGNTYRLLYSPPLKLKSNDTSVVFYTGKYKPFMYNDSTNHAVWNINYTPVKYYLDSTSLKTLYGRIQLPLKKIISDNIQQE